MTEDPDPMLDNSTGPSANGKKFLALFAVLGFGLMVVLWLVS